MEYLDLMRDCIKARPLGSNLTPSVREQYGLPSNLLPTVFGLFFLAPLCLVSTMKALTTSTSSAGADGMCYDGDTPQRGNPLDGVDTLTLRFVLQLVMPFLPSSVGPSSTVATFST